ncbi:489_t:CDS:2, partial [Ambispora gerdemannii]
MVLNKSLASPSRLIVPVSKTNQLLPSPKRKMLKTERLMKSSLTSLIRTQQISQTCQNKAVTSSRYFARIPEVQRSVHILYRSAKLALYRCYGMSSCVINTSHQLRAAPSKTRHNIKNKFPSLSEFKGQTERIALNGNLPNKPLIFYYKLHPNATTDECYDALKKDLDILLPIFDGKSNTGLKLASFRAKLQQPAVNVLLYLPSFVLGVEYTLSVIKQQNPSRMTFAGEGACLVE